MAASDKEQLSALSQQIEDLRKKVSGDGGGDTDEAKEAIKALSQLSDKLKTLEKRFSESTETETKYLSAVEENRKLAGRLEALETERRSDKIKDLTDQVKIPAFRPYVKALLDVAMREETKVVKFERADKVEDRTLDSVIKGLIEEINGHSRTLTKEHTAGGGARWKGGDELDLDDRQAVADHVDRKAREYMDTHKGSTYASAISAILGADAELKRAYSN